MRAVYFLKTGFFFVLILLASHFAGESMGAESETLRPMQVVHYIQLRNDRYENVHEKWIESVFPFLGERSSAEKVWLPLSLKKGIWSSDPSFRTYFIHSNNIKVTLWFFAGNRFLDPKNSLDRNTMQGLSIEELDYIDASFFKDRNLTGYVHHYSAIRAEQPAFVIRNFDFIEHIQVEFPENYHRPIADFYWPAMGCKESLK